MNFLKTILLGFLIGSQAAWAGLPPTTAKGQLDTSPTVTFNLQAPNSQSTRINSTTALIETGNNNLLADPSFEASSTAKWTASAGTFTYQTTTIKSDAGKQAASWVLSAATGTLSQDVTPAQPLTGVNLEASCWVNTTATTFQVCSRQGGVELQCTAVPSTGTWQKVTLNMPGPSSGSVGVDVSTTGSTTGTAYVDQCYVGSATNLAQLSQASMYGAAIWPPTASCTWSSSSTSFTNFATVAACTSPTGSNLIGYASAPATKVPGITFASLSPGEYQIVVTGPIYLQNGASSAPSYLQISDGTNSSDVVTMTPSSNTLAGNGSYTFRMAYATAQSNITLQLQAKLGSALHTMFIDDTGSGPLTIKVYRFPTGTQNGLGPDTTAASWSGYHAVSGGWNTASTTYVDPNNGTTPTLTQITNTNFGTVSTNGLLPGLTVNFPKLGTYEICANPQLQASGGAAYVSARLVDGSGTVISPGASTNLAASGNASLVPVCGQYKVTSVTSAATIKLQTATSANNVFIINATGGAAIAWTIKQLDAGQPAPLLVNSVVTRSSGITDTEAMSLTTACAADPCTTSLTSTGGIGTVNWSSAGVYVAHFTGSPYSATPWCTTSAYSGPQNGCNVTQISSSQVTVTCYNTSSGTAGNNPFGLNCVGLR